MNRRYAHASQSSLSPALTRGWKLLGITKQEVGRSLSVGSKSPLSLHRNPSNAIYVCVCRFHIYSRGYRIYSRMWGYGKGNSSPWEPLTRTNHGGRQERELNQEILQRIWRVRIDWKPTSASHERFNPRKRGKCYPLALKIERPQSIESPEGSLKGGYWSLMNERGAAHSFLFPFPTGFHR